MNKFIYASWKDAVTDAIADGMSDNRTGPLNQDSPEPEVILEDDFGSTEQSIIKYLKDTQGLYIIYTRWPLRLIRMWWGHFKYIFRKRRVI